MISSVLLVLLLSLGLAGAQVLPVNALFGYDGSAGGNPAFFSDLNSTIFFDIVAVTKTIRVTQIGLRLTCGGGIAGATIPLQLFTFAGTSRGQENAFPVGWTPVSVGAVKFSAAISAIDATNAPLGAPAGTVEPLGPEFVLADVDDFVVSTTTGVAVIAPVGCLFEYSSLNSTGSAIGNTIDTNTYKFIGAGTGFNNVNVTVSSMVERSNIQRKRNTDISSFNNPNVILQIAPPLAIGQTCTATPAAVVAGSGANNLVLSGTLSNNDFVALGPLNVFQNLTLPPNVINVVRNSGSAVNVTGCTWKVNVFPGTGQTTMTNTDADAIITNQAPNATVRGQPTPLLFQNLNFGNISDGQVTCTTAAAQCPFPIPFTSVGSVFEAQTSFFSANPFVLGFFSQQGAFTPLVGGIGGVGQNVFVYLQQVTPPASATANFPNALIGWAAGSPNAAPQGFFAVAGGNPAGLYNIRVVVVNSNNAASASNFDFELYINQAPFAAILDTSFQLLQGSQNPNALFSFVPAAPGGQDTFSFQDLCVGGSITFTTTLTVTSEADTGACAISQNLVVDPKNPSGAVVTTSPCNTCVEIDHQFTLDISKTSFCDESLTEGWNVAMYQSTLQTLTNSTSPFVTFDALLAVNTPPTVVGGPFDTVNFNDGAFIAGASCYPLDPFCLNNVNNFFFRATGRIEISVPGIYTLATVQNRGVRIIVDGQVAILNSPFQTGTFENFHSLTLSKGIHNVVVDHYDTLGVSQLRVFFATGAEPVANLTAPPSILGSSTKQTYTLLKTVPACHQPCSDNLYSGYNVRMWQSNFQQLLNNTSPFETIDTFLATNKAPDAALCGVEFINYVDTNVAPTQIVLPQFPNNVSYPLQFNATTEISNFLFFASGQFFVSLPGVYTIVAQTLRGVRVTVDGTVVILQEPVTVTPTIPPQILPPFVSLNLTRGAHSITVAHYASVGNATIGDAQIVLGIAPGNVRTLPGGGVFPPYTQLNFTLLESALNCQLPQPGVEQITAGQNFTFTLQLFNRGPSEAETLNVFDLLKLTGTAGAQLIGIRTSGAADSIVPSALSTTSNTTVIDMPVGSTRRIFFDVFVPSSAAVGSTICNNASVTAIGAFETLLNANNNISVCDTVQRLVDLELSQTQSSTVIPNVFGAPTHSIVAGAGTGAAGVSGIETYTVTVKNDGPSDTAGFTLPDTLIVPSAGVVVTSTPSVGTFAAGVWTVPVLVAGATATLTLQVQALSNATAGLNVVSNAVGSPTLATGEFLYDSFFDEKLTASCVETVLPLTTTIIRQIDLAVTKTQTLGTSPVIAGVGGSPNVGYTVTVRNLGPSDATNVDFVDTLIANGADILNGASAQGITPGNFAPSSPGAFSPGAPLCSNPLFQGVGWNVRVFQSNASIVVNGTSPLQDFDAILTSGRLPNATTTVQFINFIDFINKNGTSGDKINNGAAIPFPFPMNFTSNFFAQITGTINVFTPGFYTLGVRSNRGVRVTIDGNVVILLEPSSIGTYDSFFVQDFTAGNHLVELSFFDTSGASAGGTASSILQLLYAPQAIAKPFNNPAFDLNTYSFLPTSGACLFQCVNPLGTAKWTIQMWKTNSSVINGGPGLASPFETFDDFFYLNAANKPTITDETRDVINFDARTPISTGDLFNSPIAYPLANAASTPFFFDAKTVFFTPQDGAYTIGTTSDLGVRVLVDDETVIIHDPVTGLNTGVRAGVTGDRVNNFVNLQLARGAHTIQVTHYALGDGNATLQVFITPVASNLNINSVPTTNATFQLLKAANLCQLPVWATGVLPVGSTATLAVNLTVDHSAAIGEIFNKIDFAQPTTALEFVIDDPDGNTASVVTPIARQVNVALNKVQIVPAGNAAVVAGSGVNNLVYTVTVTNNGPSDTSGVDVLDSLKLPVTDNITGLLFAPSAAVDGLNVWHTGVIAAGASVQLNVSETVLCGAQCLAGNNTITNTATVLNLTDTRETFTNSPVAPKSVTTNVTRAVKVEVAVSARDPSVLAGAAGTGCTVFTVAVRNYGPSQLSAANVRATFTLPHGAVITDVQTFSLQPNPTLSITGSTLQLGFGPLDCGTCGESTPLIPTGVRDAAGTNCSSAADITVCAASSTPVGTNSIVAAVSFVNTGCEIVTNVGNSAPTASVSVTRAVTVNVGKAATTSTATAGERQGNVEFKVTVNNGGVSDASNVAVAELLSSTGFTNTSVFLIKPSTTNVGWNVDTFVNTGSQNTGSLAAAATLATGTPFSSETVDVLDFSNTDTFSVDALNSPITVTDFAVRATTQIFLTNTGSTNYTFTVVTRDGAQLKVDGVALVTIDGLRTTTQTTSATKALVPGAHFVEVLYFTHNATTHDLSVFMVQGTTPSTNAADLLTGSIANSYSPVNSANGVWTLPVLRAGQSAVLTAQYTANQFATHLSNVGDKATVTTVASEPNAGSAVDSASVTVHRACNNNTLSVSIASNIASVVAGSGVSVVHTITLRNVGPSHCDGVIVNFAPQTGVTGVTTSAVAGQQLLNVDSETSTSFTVTYTVLATAVPTAVNAASKIVTTASLDNGAFTTKRAAVAGTTVTTTTLITRKVNLSITKTANVDLVLSGNSVVYNITVTNNGPSDTNNLQVVDTCTGAVGCPSTTPLGGLLGGTLHAGQTVSTLIGVTTSTTGVNVVSNFATATSTASSDNANTATSSTVLTSVGLLQPTLTLSAFRTRNSFEDSSEDDDTEHCTAHEHSAERCTRLFFVELTNTGSPAARADNVVVTVGITNVALAEALLTQSSRDDTVVNNGHGLFTWTIPTLQPGARARIALKARVTHSSQQLTAHVDSADACLPQDTTAFCAGFPIASIAAVQTLSKVF